MSLTQTQIKGSVTLASDTNAITTIGVIGSGSTSINSATTNIQAGTQTDNTKAINIGQTTGAFDTTTTMNGKTTISKLTLSAPMSSSYTIVPAIGQIGYKAITILNATDPTLGADPFTLTSFVSKSVAKVELTPGTWIITANMNAPNYITAGYVLLCIGLTQDTFAIATDNYVQSATNTTFGLGFFVSQVVQITANTNYFMTARTNVTSQTVNFYKFQAYRIA